MEKPLTLERLPEAVQKLHERFDGFELLIREMGSPPKSDPDRWFTIKELCDYLPGKPALATAYGWVHFRIIPHKKFGKRLAFLKSEIDFWLKSKNRKTDDEISAGVGASLSSRKKKRGKI